jgi:hypothetical protein
MGSVMMVITQENEGITEMKREQLKVLWDGMSPILNEMQRRRYAATLSKACGYGGMTVVHEITGLSLNTITRGKKELSGTGELKTTGVREPGGGSKWTEEKYPGIREHIRCIVEGSTRGNPARILTWTTDSLRDMERKLLDRYGEKITYVTVGSILAAMGYGKHANQKMPQAGGPHPDRNGQFEFINAKAGEFIAANEPVISVDTKKKGKIENFKSSGTEYRRDKDPRKVLDHDVPVKELEKIAPYEVYCQNNNTGFVNIGTSGDTPDLAAESIARWWYCLGKHTFPRAAKLLVTCDYGGSNEYRNKVWKFRLARLAVQTGLEIHVSHFPPGTSKWNKVEHRLFCYTVNKRQEKTLIDVESAISLIGSSAATTELKVICQRDGTVYKTSQTVSDDEYESIPLTSLAPFESWNYVLNHR